jgi:NADH dehydrogenase
MLGAKTDRAGRVSVGPFMNLPDVANVFVVGDMASVLRDGQPVPGVAQAAIQQGRYVGRLIARDLKGHQPKPAHERVYHLACLGRSSCHVASPAAK